MRIITNHEDGEVEMHVVIVDSTGVDLNEYMVTGSDDHHIKHCWIPAVEGQTFEIRWFGRGPNLYSKLDILATPCLDGFDVNCGVLLAHERAQSSWGWLDSHQVSADMARPFKFGSLELTEDDEPPLDALTEDPYTIRVQLEWGWSRPQQLGQESDFHTFECPEITTSLSKQEVLLAGNYTSVTLGEPISSDILETHNFRHERNIPSAEFVFQYGPADWLQANGINLNMPSNSEVNEGTID
ncbi:unnamed protein product [Rhizoctonia solani]|uniref:DUF7918 domain-containing protein n=3 Tax=Rhizoctonia solani TaxID=456999 RepID=A0A8H3DFQ3_9AGAM|nr:hypothetical protein RSOL_416500 [Rhizoctonia solani AG-3 Rhs1AP]KEP53470.1 hypothetical protein V565_030340 [Rhizoctonia solani 123E]CAE6401188.1 unnamed protein product [Rhizoctonia solani]CAE6523696.1 unnamed protein product [Rhizoctonia solani]